MVKARALRNRTLTVGSDEYDRYAARLLVADGSDALTSEALDLERIRDCTIHGDSFLVTPRLPTGFVDLLIVDPPYNLSKSFGETHFKAMRHDDYATYVESWLVALLPLLKRDASLYVCADWRSSLAVFSALDRHCIVRNRITWRRDKGRGAATNWKNCMEDIWFATRGKDYFFDADAVKVRKCVLAPYRHDGEPKDWRSDANGRFRFTGASNFWDDLTVPYWSMPENTDHPTQKPEKLVAKLVLASSRPGDLVLDPFLGSGTTSVVAKKLGRHYVGVEAVRDYCVLAEKRLALADTDRRIQGYEDGVFRERNSRPLPIGAARSRP